MKKFNIIIADPPWSFNDELKVDKGKETKRGAQAQYNVMSLEDVKSMDVQSIVDPSWCILCLWVPSTMLADGLDVMKRWGFKFKTTYIWTKLKKNHAREINPNDKLAFGMGHLFRASHEIALIGIRGKNVHKNLKNRSQRSVSLAINEGHSVKPDNLHESLELMFPDGEKLEIFARRPRVGWTSIGDGVTGEDVNTSILKLKKEIILVTFTDILNEHGVASIQLRNFQEKYASNIELQKLFQTIVQVDEFLKSGKLDEKLNETRNVVDDACRKLAEAERFDPRKI